MGPENTTVELQISGKRLYYESIHFVELKRTRAFSAGVNSSSRVSGVGLMLEEIATVSFITSLNASLNSKGWFKSICCNLLPLYSLTRDVNVSV